MSWLKDIRDHVKNFLDKENNVTRLIRPVMEPHYVTSPYGWRMIFGKKELHTGIDYINRKDDRRVLAITDGIVTHDKDNYNDALRWSAVEHSTGNFFVIKHRIHGKFYYVGYQHIVENVVKIGQTVKQGQVLGSYGNVGRSTGPHLHLDMWDRRWNKINPTYILLRGIRANGLAT